MSGIDHHDVVGPGQDVGAHRPESGQAYRAGAGGAVGVAQARVRDVGGGAVAKIPEPVRDRAAGCVRERYCERPGTVERTGGEVGDRWRPHNQVHLTARRCVNPVRHARVRRRPHRQDRGRAVGGQRAAIGEQCVRSVREAAAIGDIEGAIQRQVAGDDCGIEGRAHLNFCRCVTGQGQAVGEGQLAERIGHTEHASAGDDRVAHDTAEAPDRAKIGDQSRRLEQAAAQVQRVRRRDQRRANVDHRRTNPNREHVARAHEETRVVG